MSPNVTECHARSSARRASQEVLLLPVPPNYLAKTEVHRAVKVAQAPQGKLVQPVPGPNWDTQSGPLRKGRIHVLYFPEGRQLLEVLLDYLGETSRLNGAGWD